MRDIRRGRGRAFTAGAGLSCLLAACGSGTAAPAGKLSSSALQILMYGRPAPELRTKVDNAVSVLTTSCMRAKHLIYYPTLETLAQNSIPPTSEFPPYGNLAQRQANGYGLYASAVRQASSGAPGDAKAQPPANKENAYTQSLPAAARANYDLALYGPTSDMRSYTLPGRVQVQTPTLGCTALADRQVYGSVTNFAQAFAGAYGVGVEFVHEVVSSARYKKVTQAWSACMKKQGFHYGQPLDAYRGLAAQLSRYGPTKSSQKQEIMVAVADWECARKVSLVPVTTAVRKTTADHLSQSLKEYLLRITKVYRQAAKSAAKLAPNA